MFIVFEGVDNSGKTTQTQIIKETLEKEYKVEKFSFPVKTTRIGKEIDAFLRGEVNYSPYVISLLFSANRWEHKDILEEKIKNNDFLIMDRYYYSNVAYWSVRGLDENWLLNLDKGLPEPDIVFYLDIDYEDVVKRRKEEFDIIEKNGRLLKETINYYRQFAKKHNWIFINARKDVAQVSKEILEIIKNK